MLQDNLSIAEYMQQKRDTREALCAIFSVKRTGRTETVVDATGVGKCISDGATYSDLQAITFDKLVTYLGGADENDNIHSLFVKAVNKIESPMFVLPMPTVEDVPVIDKIVEETKVEEENKVVLPQADKKIDLHKMEDTKTKCAKCAFETASKIAMKMHFGRFHKDYN